MNFVTADTLVRAGRSIRTAKVFALGIPLEHSGPRLGGNRTNPVHMMTETARGRDCRRRRSRLHRQTG